MEAFDDIQLDVSSDYEYGDYYDSYDEEEPEEICESKFFHYLNSNFDY
jgi:hypothetical protein